MKKFNFRYESVLKMRLDQEDRIKNELAKLISKRQDYVDSLDVLIENAETYDKHIQKVLSDGDAQNERQQFTQGKKYYRDHKNKLKAKIAAIEVEIQKTQAKLVEAMKERKVMDKLKEKAFQEFVDAVNEADAKLIEEVVNYSNNKKIGD
jgi:flagellar FliJ protein